MYVDARDAPRSSILAIVATLASAALLSFSLRLYSRGKLLRNLGTDDWLLLVAALCTIGALVIIILVREDLEKQTWPTTADDRDMTSLLVWIFILIHIVGVGFVKLSATLSLLQHALQNWYRCTILFFLCLITVLTVFWFGSTLLFCGPITVSWSSVRGPEVLCKLLSFINSVLDVATALLIMVLSITVIQNLHHSLATVLPLFVAFAFALAAMVAAAIQTYTLYNAWSNSDLNEHISSIMLWSSIELTTGIMALCPFTLQPMASSIHQYFRSRSDRHFPTSSNRASHQYSSHAYGSTQTIIHRPNAPHLLSLRFHDDESNVDFDIETPRVRTRTHTMHSRMTRTTHSRNVSDWSQFSGFTYYTQTAASAHATTPSRSRVVSMNGLEARTKSIGVGRPGGDGMEIGMAVTTLHDKPVKEPEAGEEMAELVKLFADDNKEWGTVSSHSGRTSVMTDKTRASRLA